MQTLTQHQRQINGCGFAPSLAGEMAKHVGDWTGCGYKGEPTTVCPGYTTKLPEVIEIARARLHWSKGNLPLFAEDPLHPVAIGVEILESSSNECQSWMITPQSKGGGAEG
jgi:hypothetical protein